jgi:hypothetical protein
MSATGHSQFRDVDSMATKLQVTRHSLSTGSAAAVIM